MNYLSLYSGIAGGDLAMQHLIGMECVGYIEIDEYCQKVIAQRQKDGFIDKAPIFGDIRAFLNSGYARSYQGLVDFITAGFPCQPHSTAGKRKGAADERDMWPATVEVICMVRPQFVFLENVPGIIQGQEPYVWRVISALSALGYDSRWCVLGARDVGAPHRRDRWWCLGVDDTDKGIEGHQDPARRDIQAGAENSSDGVAHAAGSGGPKQECQYQDMGRAEFGDSDGRSGSMAIPTMPRLEGWNFNELQGNPCRDAPTWPPGHTERDKWVKVLSRWPELAPALSREEEAQCDIHRGIDGVSNRMERLKALGNAQVALCAATAWRILNDLYR